MKRIILKILTSAALGVCLAMPILFFLGKASLRGFRSIFLAASLGYLLSAAFLSRRPRS